MAMPGILQRGYAFVFFFIQLNSGRSDQECLPEPATCPSKEESLAGGTIQEKLTRYRERVLLALGTPEGDTEGTALARTFPPR